MVLPISGASQAVPSTLVDNPVYMIKDQLNTATFPAGSLAAAQQLVGPAILDRIEIKTPPTKTVYTVGEAMDWSGLTVTGTFSDGSTKEYDISSSEVTLDTASGATFGEANDAHECRVTVKVGSVSKTVSFTVNVKAIVHVTGITTDVPDGKLSLEAGTASDIRVSILPPDATDKRFRVESSDTNVATVSGSEGSILVTGVGPGSATITVTSVDGSHTAVVDVTVTAAA